MERLRLRSYNTSMQSTRFACASARLAYVLPCARSLFSLSKKHPVGVLCSKWPMCLMEAAIPVTVVFAAITRLADSGYFSWVDWKVAGQAHLRSDAGTHP